MKKIPALFLILAVVLQAYAKPETGESLEWLADTSPVIGIYTASAPGSRAVMRDYLQFSADLKLKETLKGAPPLELKPQQLYFIANSSSPGKDVADGDRFLVFLCPDAKAKDGALGVEYVISLTKPAAPVSFQMLAFTAKFEVLADEKAILSAVRDRMAAHPGTSPLPKPGEWEESAVGVPLGSPAYQALDRGSSVSMMLPADLAAPMQAKQEVMYIVNALQGYYSVKHTMPKGGSGKIIETLMDTSATRGSSPFFSMSGKALAKFNKTGKFLDPWGTPYRIDASNPNFPWVYSFGPDKIDDGGASGSDDVVSW